MNKSFIIGLIFLAFFLFIAVFGPALAPFPVDYDEKIFKVQTEEGEKILSSPMEPDKRHPFGTDPWGYDLLTLLLYGARYTVFLSIGIAVLQAGLITIFGIPGVFPVLLKQARKVEGLQFIEAAHSMGAHKTRILLRHIVPQLIEPLILLVSQETIAVLVLIGQLGIFDMFIGGTLFTSNPALFHSVTHEWPVWSASIEIISTALTNGGLSYSLLPLIPSCS